MTNQEKLIELAKMDGYKQVHIITGGQVSCPQYLTSYDAIIPLVRKYIQTHNIDFFNELRDVVCADADEPRNLDYTTLLGMVLATPAQLSEALLRATGKWED